MFNGADATIDYDGGATGFKDLSVVVGGVFAETKDLANCPMECALGALADKALNVADFYTIEK